MQQELLKSAVQESLKPFENILRYGKINIKITREPMGGYKTSVHVYGGAKLEQIDIAITKALAQYELGEKEKEKNMKKTSAKTHENSG